jgi:hypothetical protein
VREAVNSLLNGYVISERLVTSIVRSSSSQEHRNFLCHLDKILYAQINYAAIAS